MTRYDKKVYINSFNAKEVSMYVYVYVCAHVHHVPDTRSTMLCFAMYFK